MITIAMTAAGKRNLFFFHAGRGDVELCLDFESPWLDWMLFDSEPTLITSST
ncbi:hypothetical protein TC41_2027 [Alicyclobacillus acidocaldarius subsp. acidocaldarius Tc-4-1]|uniref:Uncharacterized protein n=1 Tax=Alicyclobacillus acidocaldarius (strain Tc-4-1) TaxID=1048834 RepID=F8IEP3_ALIAT|nr:hypothetical protein TC41_2027 [Alicyclobacillus acidocaldarius subsp. acidocaldarius Tc-4-1]